MATKKQVRAAFRIAVLKRDGYCCAMCGKPGKDRQGGDGHLPFHRTRGERELAVLDAHHITDRKDMPNGGYAKENGISLCADCHVMAELHHQTGTAHPGFAPEDLYAKIDSSVDLAHQASQALS